jgi:toxin HigB-1
MRIRSFRHKGLKRLYEAGDRRGNRPDLVPKLELIIHAIERHGMSIRLGGFPGGSCIHSRAAGVASEWSVWVTGNHRVTFRVHEDDVTDIDLEDYHGK